MLRRSIGALVVVIGLVFAFGTVQAQLTACTSNCAAVSVEGGTGQAGQSVTLQVDFTQALDDGTPMSGNDDTAAIAMTIGLGDTNTPFSLADCNDTNPADGLPDAVTVGPGITDQFRVVIENAFCTNRPRCLCADTTQSQTRDNFINIVVYGPKDLPAEGQQVEIPALPDTPDLNLMSVRLAIAQGAVGQTITIPIYSEITGSPPKPLYGANLSIGDQAAVDQTANRGTNTSKVNVQSGEVEIRPDIGGCTSCVGDCDKSGAVAVNELVLGVNIALDLRPFTECPCFDTNGNMMVEVNELILAVNNALNECPAP